jgi:hypothetical protein
MVRSGCVVGLGHRSSSMQDDAEPVINPETLGRADVVELSGRARQLWEALSGRNEQLGHMYLGALDVLQHRANPDRLALAAHGIREMLEKLPRYLDIPDSERGVPKLGDSASRLVGKWQKWRSTATDDGGVLTKNGRRLLNEVDRFCESAQAGPTKKALAAAALKSIDPHPVDLPTHVRETHASVLVDLDRYFTDVSHHRRTDEQELLQRLAALESFLLDRLRPRTFDDFAEIDRLLGEDGS